MLNKAHVTARMTETSREWCDHSLFALILIVVLIDLLWTMVGTISGWVTMHRKTTTKAGMKERARLQTDRGSQNHGQQPGRQAPGMKERAWLQMDQAHRTMSHNREGRYQSGMRQPGSRPRGPPKPCPSTTKEVNRYKTDEHHGRHQTWKREPGSKEWGLPKPCPLTTKAATRYKRDLHEGRHQAWKREPGLEERAAQAMSPNHKVINRRSNDKSKGNVVIVNNCQSSKISL